MKQRASPPPSPRYAAVADSAAENIDGCQIMICCDACVSVVLIAEAARKLLDSCCRKLSSTRSPYAIAYVLINAYMMWALSTAIPLITLSVTWCSASISRCRNSTCIGRCLLQFGLLTDSVCFSCWSLLPIDGKMVVHSTQWRWVTLLSVRLSVCQSVPCS